ncbi:TniQ protein [Paraburkholderia aspalathi]|uniref:TniQ protein n=1 Tax=Paraburkholderia aspalathi TaxID=1324617 RepID=A0A1I7ER75_9BURK|nr:TniQ family protein [Paraburkholderia aspalathi]SFU26419.1 TniQ protein [Paraburkholderia aspalathi]
MILLCAAERETPPGYLMRTAVVSGMRSVQTQMKLMGLRQTSSFFGVANLERLAAATCGALGDVYEIVERRTPIAAGMRLLMAEPERDRLFMTLSGDTSRCRSLDYHGSRSGYLRTNLDGAYCQLCAQSDIKELGYTYWNVEHAFRGVYACARHSCSLTLGCGVCQQSQPFRRALRFPALECSCGRLATPILENGSTTLSGHIRIAKILVQCLRQDTPYFSDVCDIRSVFEARAREHGFVARGRIDRIGLCHELSDRYGVEFLIGLGLIAPSGLPSIVGRLRLKHKPLSAPRCALLIDFLFGSLDDFSDAVLQSSPRDDAVRNVPKTSRTEIQPDNKKTGQCVNKILSFRGERPSATRTEILRRLGHTAEYLMRNEPQIYEEIMPASRRTVGAREKRPARMRELDNALSEHVRTRKSALRMGPSREWRRLSVRSLLLGHPAERSFYANRDALPLTSSLIDEYLRDDSWWKNTDANLAEIGGRISCPVSGVDF